MKMFSWNHYNTKSLKFFGDHKWLEWFVLFASLKLENLPPQAVKLLQMLVPILMSSYRMLGHCIGKFIGERNNNDEMCITSV
jgi:hypothetical protein